MSDHAAKRGKQGEGNLIHESKGNDSLALEAKPRDLKFPSVDVNERYTLGYKDKSSCAAEDGYIKSSALQFGEIPKFDGKTFEAGESSKMRRNTMLFNDGAKSSSTQQLAESSIKWKNSKSYSSHSLDVSRSEFEHFPMFDINRKIEAIMTSNKKYAYGAMPIKMKERLSLHEKMMMPYEGLLPDNTDDIGGAASRFFHISGKSLTTGRSDTDSNSRYVGNSWTSVKEGSTHMLREPSPSYHSYPSLIDRHDAEAHDDSSNRIFVNQERLVKPKGSDMHLCSCKISQCSIHDVVLPETCQNFKPVESGERFHMCIRKPTTRDYAFARVNETSFSERRIVPFGQIYGKKEISTVSFKNSTSNDVRNDRIDTGAHLMGASNESSSRTDTIYNHPFCRSSSLLGETFSSAQKDVASSNTRIESTSARPSKPTPVRNLEDVIAGRQPVQHSASTDNNETGTSQTESMALDQSVSLAMIAGNTSGSETRNKWVKRLQDIHSGSLSLGTKRFKQSLASSSEYYNPKCISSSKTATPSSGHSEKSVRLWIRRWGHNSRKTYPAVSRQERSKELSEKFEGKLLGSIGAMALMGRAMKDYRPCKFRRKQASLVWNTLG